MTNVTVVNNLPKSTAISLIYDLGGGCFPSTREAWQGGLNTILLNANKTGFKVTQPTQKQIVSKVYGESSYSLFSKEVYSRDLIMHLIMHRTSF